MPLGTPCLHCLDRKAQVSLPGQQDPACYHTSLLGEGQAVQVAPLGEDDGELVSGPPGSASESLLWAGSNLCSFFHCNEL